MSRAAVLLLLLFLSAGALSQTTPYTVLKDPRHPEKNMLVGQISPYILLNDSSFSWFPANQKGYSGSAPLMSALSSSSGVCFIVFAGTWCEDSHFIIPRFFRTLESAGFPNDRLVLYALDRDKKMPGGLTTALGITNVPTIIVTKNGKETGRVIEYGKTGKWDEEIAELVK
jgi:hypothetical protein